MDLFFYYLIAVNVLGFSLFGIDKSRARRHAWRIPEKTLFAAAVLGGSIGCLAGMYPSFTIGLPLILALQCFLAYWISIQ